MDFTISGRAGGSTMVHDETLPARLVEEVHNACLFVEETVCWVFDGNKFAVYWYLIVIICFDKFAFRKIDLSNHSIRNTQFL